MSDTGHYLPVNKEICYQRSEITRYVEKLKNEILYLILSFFVVLFLTYFSSLLVVLLYFEMLLSTVLSMHLGYEAIRRKRYICLLPLIALFALNCVIISFVDKNGFNFPEVALWMINLCLIVPVLFHLIIKPWSSIYKRTTALLGKVPLCLSGWLIGGVFWLLVIIVIPLFVYLFIPAVVILTALFIYKKVRAKNADVTYFQALITDLTDFYVSAPVSEIVSTDFTERMTIKKGIDDDLSIGRFNLAASKKIDSEKIFLYFRPEDAENIPECDREKVLTSITAFLNMLKGFGKKVYVLSDSDKTDISQKDNLDFLTRGLYEKEFALFFDESELDQIITGKRDVSETFLSKEGQATLSHKDYSCSFGMEDRFNYILKQFEDGKRSNNAVEQFYGLVKIVEYIFQYRALFAACKDQKTSAVDEEFGYNMGDYNVFQLSLSDSDKEYYLDSDKDIVLAERLVRSLTNEAKANSERFTYGDISRSFVTLRNKYIGHGTMAYSVSEELLDAVYVLSLEVIRVFALNSSGALLSRNTCLNPDYVFGNDVSAALEQNGRLYLLSLVEKDSFEETDGKDALILTYVDFLGGDVIVKGNRHKKNLLLNGRITYEK